jgi:hypothetical protein
MNQYLNSNDEFADQIAEEFLNNYISRNMVPEAVSSNFVNTKKLDRSKLDEPIHTIDSDYYLKKRNIDEFNLPSDRYLNDINRQQNRKSYKASNYQPDE